MKFDTTIGEKENVMSFEKNRRYIRGINRAWHLISLPYQDQVSTYRPIQRLMYTGVKRGWIDLVKVINE